MSIRALRAGFPVRRRTVGRYAATLTGFRSVDMGGHPIHIEIAPDKIRLRAAYDRGEWSQISIADLLTQLRARDTIGRAGK